MIMITKNGNIYPTITDAAKEFGVSNKTVREWIEKGIIAEPPKVDYGVRLITYFPPKYIEKAKLQIQRYRDRKAERNQRREKKHG